MEKKEGNLEWWAAGAGEIGEMKRFDRDKREEPPEKEDQKKIKQNREKKEQRREEKSQYEKKRKQKHFIHFLESPRSRILIYAALVLLSNLGTLHQVPPHSTEWDNSPPISVWQLSLCVEQQYNS